ncbi:MAG: right-handed parallel beta-helix repeat-containing protein [Methanomassiliicoccus sp.]|nr:right-handed parallel beta-helix repeat-containing protein [Methanomassiliicoccus sp.]
MNARGFSVSLVVLLLSAAFVISMLNLGIASGASTAPVSISGDPDLASKAASNGWPGNGTQSNPYVIADVRVDDPANGLGIFVSGTTKHLVIENCQITNTSSYAIDITGASNITIRGSVISSDHCAVLLYSSTGCTVANNSITGSKTGVQLMSSDRNVISGNNISGSQYNGIELFTSNNNTITGNTVTGSGGYGIYLSSSDGNLIFANSFVSNNGAAARYDAAHPQAYDLGTNEWSRGGVNNEWSDWTSDDIYPYEGSAAADDLANTLPMDDLLPILAVVGVGIIALVAVAAVLIKRKKVTGPSQGGVQPSAPPVQHPTAGGAVTPPPMKAPKKRTWIPALVLGAVLVVVVLVAASTMGWLPIGSGKLTGARDIGGQWEGTATYWSYNIYGEKALLIEANVEMKLTLNGNHVTGIIDMDITSQTPLSDLYVLEPDGHFQIDGTYESTTLTFETYKTEFRFEFLTDMATGQMTNLDTYAYLGLGSEPSAIHLQRA